MAERGIFIICFLKGTLAPGNYKRVNITLIPRNILEHIVKTSIFTSEEKMRLPSGDQQTCGEGQGE